MKLRKVECLTLNLGSFYRSSCIIVCGFCFTTMISNDDSIQIVDHCRDYADTNKEHFFGEQTF